MSGVLVVKAGLSRAVVAAGLRGRQGERGEQGTPFEVSATGLLANRGAFDGEADGFSYLATDTGDLYFRQGAAGIWSDPVRFQGPAGDSAYQIAVNNGFIGTEAEWLAALDGTDGADGVDGTDGLSIIGAAIDGNGHLLLTLSNSTVLDAGYVVGQAGVDGVDGTDGADGNDGAAGTDGRGIVSMAIDGSDHLIITYTDSSTEDAGLIPDAGVAAMWGGISGTLADQADLAAALANKVDKEAGKGLSSNDFTSAEKTKLAGLEGSHFKGLHASLAALQAAHPTAVAGDYADVDAGAGVDVVRYLWDVTDAEWIAQASSGGSMTAAQVKTAYESNPDTNAFTDSEKAKLAGISAGATANADTDSLVEGASNKYFTDSRVRGAVLTGLSLLSGGAITAADSVLSALGRLQKQITDALAAIAGKQDTLVSGTSLKTVNGNSLLGSGDIAISGGTQCIPIACSDETTALTAGSAKVTFRMPYAFTLSAVRASLTTAQASGSILTVDINEGATSILSTKLTIDNTEKTSTTAAAAAVISDSALANDAEITIDIDQVGDGTAKGLKVYLIGVPS